MMQQTWLGGDAGQFCSGIVDSSGDGYSSVPYTFKSGVFYPAVIICLLSAILSRVGGSVVNARGDGILP